MRLNWASNNIDVAARIIMGLVCLMAAGCGSRQDGDGYMLLVDQAVDAADAAQDSVARLLDSRLRMVAQVDDLRERFDGELDLSGRYLSFDLHEALRHVSNAVKLSMSIDDEAKVIAQLRLASLYNSSGMMLKEAADIFESVNPCGLDEKVRLEYFILGVQLNRSLSERAMDEGLERIYRDKMISCRDSVLSIDPGSRMIAVNQLIDAGNLVEAERVIREGLPDGLTTRGAGPNYHVLAGIYGRMGDSDRRRFYLAQAAVCDLKNGVREYMALQELAACLLEDGDVMRAYKYIHRSAHDAAACHALQRQLEIAPALQLIDAAYSQMKERQSRTVMYAGMFLLAVAVVIAVFYCALRRKNRRLADYSRELAEVNGRLREAYEVQTDLNGRIAEESRVKERYITGFMEQCLDYLQKMERFRAELNKIAASRDLDKLTKAISSSRYVNREVADFYDKFDKAFLSLYPDFVEKLNSLLREECRYDCRMTSFTTELRVYALIKLGITNSGSIARFLRCSDSTVYNYRTQMRNRAINRDTFEEDMA